MTMTTQELFKPEKISARDKAATTSQFARQIIETEAAERIRKTTRLRLLREARPIEPKPIRLLDAENRHHRPGDDGLSAGTKRCLDDAFMESDDASHL